MFITPSALPPPVAHDATCSFLQSSLPSFCPSSGPDPVPWCLPVSPVLSGSSLLTSQWGRDPCSGAGSQGCRLGFGSPAPPPLDSSLSIISIPWDTQGTRVLCPARRSPSFWHSCRHLCSLSLRTCTSREHSSLSAHTGIPDLTVKPASQESVLSVALCSCLPLWVTAASLGP